VFTAPASFAAAAENTEWVGGETTRSAHPSDRDRKNRKKDVRFGFHFLSISRERNAERRHLLMF
jgi:hypothetical protein